MNDDWRLTVEVTEDAHATQLGERLGARELEHDLEDSFGETVIVSRDGTRLYCYAANRSQLSKVDSLVSSLASEHGWVIETSLAQWHPDAEEWEDPDKPLPASDEERAAEHGELIERERGEAEQSGRPEWEVRIDCRSHGDAVKLAEKLEAEGLNPVRRWKYVIVGASDEDSANELAKRLSTEAPEGSEISAEGTWQEAREGAPPNPFAFLGGLGDS